MHGNHLLTVLGLSLAAAAAFPLLAADTEILCDFETDADLRAWDVTSGSVLWQYDWSSEARLRTFRDAVNRRRAAMYRALFEALELSEIADPQRS